MQQHEWCPRPTLVVWPPIAVPGDRDRRDRSVDTKLTRYCGACDLYLQLVETRMRELQARRDQDTGTTFDLVK
eukprot:SAG25_NODE_10963_length_318_cov_0.593607_1_plen_72_part_01